MSTCWAYSSLTHNQAEKVQTRSATVKDSVGDKFSSPEYSLTTPGIKQRNRFGYWDIYWLWEFGVVKKAEMTHKKIPDCSGLQPGMTMLGRIHYATLSIAIVI
jgi:hypothetical protein